MTMLDTGFDAYFYPVEIGAGEAFSLFFPIGGGGTGAAGIEVDPGIYALCAGTEYPSLLAHIATKMNDLGIAQTWSWERVGFLVGGVEMPGWGVQLVSGDSFRIERDPGSDHLFSLLGWDFNDRAAFDTGGSGWVLGPDKPHGGAWRTLRPPQRRPLNTIAEQYVSGGRGQGLHLTRWGADRIRSVLYRNVPAAHVIEGRATIQAYADVASLGLGWTMNQFCDLWDVGISRYQPVYAAYNLTDMPNDITTADRWEILQSPQGSQYADEFESCITRASRSAEHYDVEFAMRVIGGNDTWG